jgi:hypothetical protein
MLKLDEPCKACGGNGAIWRGEEEEYDQEVWGDEESVSCGECDATGRVLTDDGQELMAFLRRHGFAKIGA